MTSALPAPTVAGLVTHWAWQPLAIVVVVALGAWYVRGVRTVLGRGRPWPLYRSATFTLGLVLAVWTTCGFPQAYQSSLFYVWTSQQLGLLLVIPLVVLFGGPLELARQVHGRDGWCQRLLRSRPARVLANPLIGPAVVPVLSAVLFFGPLPRWCVDIAPVGWIEELAVVAVGAIIVLPLVGDGELPSSLRIGLGLAIGSFELVLDSVPGIALRLHRSLSTSYFDVRLDHVWALAPVKDQQLSGAILWAVAELIDLPFLVLVYRQWLRADARDAAQVDAVLEAERAARGPAPQDTFDEPRDQPWWLSDPEMQERLRHRR